MTHHALAQSICLQAIDVFNEMYDGALIQAGPMRVTGASAFTIDCKKTQHRLIVTTLDNNPEKCAIALTDLSESSNDDDLPHDVLPVAKLDVLTVVKYMETKFAK